MKLRLRVLLALAVLPATGCTPASPVPVVPPSEGILDTKLIGSWRVIGASTSEGGEWDVEADSFRIRVLPFDEHQLLVEWASPQGCGYECSEKPGRQEDDLSGCVWRCDVDPVFGAVDVSPLRVLVTVLDGATWLSARPLLDDDGDYIEEAEWWLGRIEYQDEGTVLLRLLDGTDDELEAVHTPEKLRPFLTEGRLSAEEWFRFERIP